MIEKHVASIQYDVQWLKRVVSLNCPDFFLHPDDRYMPCSTEWFIQHSSLCARLADGSVQNLVPLGGLAGHNLLEFQELFKNQSSSMWMELDPESRTGQPLHMLHDIPVYANVKAVFPNFHVGRDPEALEINYITLFAYNGHYSIAGALHVGAHDGDIEHCTARVNPRTGQLIAMWYNSHRSRDGEWVPADKVPRTSSGRPVAYIALHGHGNYPRVSEVTVSGTHLPSFTRRDSSAHTPNPFCLIAVQTGRILRHVFLGNDRCSENGPVWSPRKIVLLPNHSIGATEKVTHDGDAKLSIHSCQSRGCGLPLVTAETETEAVGELLSVDNFTSGHFDLDKYVIHDDPCEWLYFRGDWGKATAPLGQRWMHDAETPVSRTSIQRIFLHIWPETESL